MVQWLITSIPLLITSFAGDSRSKLITLLITRLINFLLISFTLVPCSSSNADCLELMRNNQTDILINNKDFNYIYGDANLHPLQILFSETASIISSYNCSVEYSRENSKAVDVIDSTNAFRSSTWILIAFTLLIFAILIKIHIFIQDEGNEKDTKISRVKIPGTEITRKRIPKDKNPKLKQKMFKNSALFLVYTFMIEKSSFKLFNWNSKLLSILITVFSLIIFRMYFCNLIITDKVVVKIPFVAKSYQDILDHAQLEANFYSSASFKTKLMLSEADSVIGRLRKWMRKQKTLKGISVTDVTVGHLNNLSRVMITTSQFATDWTRNVICSQEVEDPPPSVNPNYCTFESSDGFSTTNRGIVSSAHFRNSQEHMRVKKCYERDVEMGIFKKMYEIDAPYSMTGHLGPSLYDCLLKSNQPVIHPPDFEPLSIGGIKRFLLIMTITTSISPILLALEKLHKFVVSF